MKIKKNGVTINLTESDLKRIVKSQMINEQSVGGAPDQQVMKNAQEISSLNKRVEALETLTR